jgi:hypothetical protein
MIDTKKSREMRARGTAARELFGDWWKKSGLRMSRTFYIEEAQSPREYIDSQKALEIEEGYWHAEKVIAAVCPLLERNAAQTEEIDRLREALASCREQAIEGKLAMKKRYGWRGTDSELFSRFCNIEKASSDE